MGIAKKGYEGEHGSEGLRKGHIGSRSYMPENTGEDKDNISNMPYTDKAINSPPYLEAKLQYDIGNSQRQTYLEAMLVVYQQCYKVLKPQGLMILITKDFIRNKKRIPLGEHTIKLCEMVGFKHIHTYHRKIEHPSFWRLLYYQKHPEVEKIDCEDILVFRKG